MLADPLLQQVRHKHCPICSHDQARLIAQTDRDSIPLDTVICDACGLIFSLSIYTPEAMSHFYSTYYRTLFDNKTNDEGSINDSLHRHYKLKGSYKIRSYIKPKSTILELGCGGGWALQPYHKAGFSYYGFDYNDDYIEFGKKHYNLNLFVGGVTEAINKDIKADYLFMNHVLEHTPDPIGFLQSLKPLLNQDAFINISVPSVNFMWFGGGGTSTRLLDTLQLAHTVLFDDITLAYVVQKAGFRIVNHIGGHILLSYSPKDTASIAVTAPQSRGKFIFNKLNFFEKTPWRTAWIPSSLKHKAHYFHYGFYPLQTLKKIFML